MYIKVTNWSFIKVFTREYQLKALKWNMIDVSLTNIIRHCCGVSKCSDSCIVFESGETGRYCNIGKFPYTISGYFSWNDINSNRYLIEIWSQ